MNTLSTCRPGSAWHAWQTAGETWRANNPEPDPVTIETAAHEFASACSGSNAQAAAHRAFREGATLKMEG